MTNKYEHQKPRVLIIDDQEEICGLIALLLEDDFTATTCYSGFDAAEKIKTENFNLVITDLNMPNFNGLKIIDTVKIYQPNTPIVIISGFGMQDKIVIDALQKGATGFLEKPFGEVSSVTNYLASFIKNKATS